MDSDRELRKNYRERAHRARRGLLKEKKEYGDISDGSGKRYRAGVFYVLSGDVDKALDFYGWYESEFPDDVGEPVFSLYWALAANRAGRQEEARMRLKDAMLQNLYMLPELFGEHWDRVEIRHLSNQQEPDYLEDVEEFLNEPTVGEREWIREMFYSDAFRELRDSYIDHFHRLLHEDDRAERRRIVQSWRHCEKRLMGND